MKHEIKQIILLIGDRYQYLCKCISIKSGSVKVGESGLIVRNICILNIHRVFVTIVSQNEQEFGD